LKPASHTSHPSTTNCTSGNVNNPPAIGLSSKNIIYTLGYGGRRFEDFLSLLKRHGINLVVDVRRFPKSKYSEYVKENLEQALSERGIRYVFMGDTLGGFRRGYEEYMKTEAYMRGIKDLLDLAQRGKVALLCLERSPRGCHRRYISQTLQDLGVQILHIIKDNEMQEENFS